MAFFSRPTAIAPPYAGSNPVGSLDQQVLALPGLAGWWDFDQLRITAGTDTAIANRVSGGSDTTEVTALSALALSMTHLPPGGQMRQAGLFAADTSLLMGGSIGTGASNRFTKVIAFRSNPVDPFSGGSQVLWGGPSGGTSNHNLLIGGSTMTASVGSTGSAAVAQQRFPMAAWCYAIQSWDAVTGIVSLSVGRATPTTATALGQVNNQTSAYFGGHATVATFNGRMGAMLLFSAAGSDGNLFAAGNASRLALVRDMMDAKIGVLNLEP